MNATEKAKVLKANGYSHVFDTTGYSSQKVHAWSFGGIAISESPTKATATHAAFDHLEAQLAQAANDAAGKEAYEEVKADRANYSVQFEAEADYNFALIAPDGELVDFSYSDGVGLDKTAKILNSETEDLRQQLADARAENARLTSAMNKAVSQLGYVTFHSAHAAELILKRALAGEEFSHIGIEQPAAPVSPAPKTPVPTRCRVNWNARGFSSGSYPVLGYSPEKQSYVLNISTDNAKVMPKTVKMADCESVS